VISPAYITEWSQQCPWTSPAQVEPDLRERLNPWLGEPKSDISSRGATLTYRFESELPPVIRLRLKIEINTREHLCLLPIQQTEFAVDSRWFSGEATLPIYATTELLGTKLRALYQRRKGRDLFDLWQAHQAGVLDAPAVADAFVHYMRAENHPVSSAEFSLNLAAKMKHAGFLSDTPPLLRPGIHYNPTEAFDWVQADLISQLS